jgi:hypothetical protein
LSVRCRQLYVIPARGHQYFIAAIGNHNTHHTSQHKRERGEEKEEKRERGVFFFNTHTAYRGHPLGPIGILAIYTS